MLDTSDFNHLTKRNPVTPSCRYCLCQVCGLALVVPRTAFLISRAARGGPGPTRQGQDVSSPVTGGQHRSLLVTQTTIPTGGLPSGDVAVGVTLGSLI
ncbi:hypothetical protein E2C01_043645 [Portunus trituberculatus]|uniref:Uncharacterized protein n=1 Tax=Portunus trituberculatus TaxID=210409 RepID=A0A5B7FQ10_PORTR|nr:hypothetical protein [Portunus trituberculatus]